MRVYITVTEENGKQYEGEADLIELKKASVAKGTKSKPSKPSSGWYKHGSTTEKIVFLVNEDFFEKNRTLHDIVERLKTKDYHFKPSELTMALRAIVRKGLLKKTKDLPDGTKSKQWTYVKN